MADGFGAFGSRLRFEADGFVYAGRKTVYSDVGGVYFTQKMWKRGTPNATPTYESRLQVFLKSGKRLALMPYATMSKRLSTEDKVVHDTMVNAADWLHTYTFDARMDGYEAQLKARGYVTFGKYQIKPNGDLYRRFAFCMNLRESGARCLMYPQRLVCIKGGISKWTRLWHRVFNFRETIDLKRDKDCFLYFMRRHVNLLWPDEPLRLHRGVAADWREQAEQPQAAPQAGAGMPHAGSAQAGGSGAQERVRQSPPPPPPPPKPMPSYVQHLATLGLKADAEWPEVKATYRKLARQHHPDLLRGKGASESVIRTSEAVLKNVNEAYGWLEDFYKLK